MGKDITQQKKRQIKYYDHKTFISKKKTNILKILKMSQTVKVINVLDLR